MISTLARSPADNCSCCDGAVQRNARLAEGLGELWEVPLDVNVHVEQLGPRLPGPGILTLAFTPAEAQRQEAA